MLNSICPAKKASFDWKAWQNSNSPNKYLINKEKKGKKTKKKEPAQAIPGREAAEKLEEAMAAAETLQTRALEAVSKATTSPKKMNIQRPYDM